MAEKNDGARLYEYHVLDRSGEKTVTVVEPTEVLAISPEVARQKAIRQIPADHEDALDAGKLEVNVRPLA